MVVIVNSVNKVFEFNPVIYPVSIWITVGIDANKLSKEFNQQILELPEDLEAKTDCIKHEDKCGILIRFKDKDSIHFKSASHESAHAALKIFNKVGGKLNDGSDELFAYLCGFIGDCIQCVYRDISK